MEPIAGPLEWYRLNTDLMVFCLLISFVASGITIFLKNARGSSVAVSLLSSFLFVSLGIPSLAIRYKWYWTDLALCSAIIGFGSLTLAWTFIRIAGTLQRKAETGVGAWADGAIRKLGSGGEQGLPPVPPGDPQGATKP